MSQEHKCPSCGSTALEFSKEDYTLEYKGSTLVVEELEYYQCNECEESFYTRPSERKMDKAFSDLKRQVENLLTSDELKELRGTLGLTQEQLSILLGMAPKTLARYENGSVIQSRATDLLLRLIRDNPSNLEFLDQYATSNSNAVEDAQRPKT